MLDIRRLRAHPEEIAQALARRGVPAADVHRLLELDATRRALITEGDELRAVQKQRSRLIGSAETAEAREALIAEVQAASSRLDALDPEQRAVEEQIDGLLAVLPNLPHPEAPDGEDEHDAVERLRFGTPPAFTGEVRDHVEIGEALGIIDIPRGVKVSGSRFAFLLGHAVLLEFALVRYALDRLAPEGFTPVIPPVLTRADALYGTAFLPTGAEQIYEVGRDELYLVGTSEVPLAGLHAEEILDEADLPVRYAGFSTCFRREAGTYGKDTRGIFRVHQFDKVEMFSFCHPDVSEQEHDLLRDLQVDLLAGLGLHGRVVDVAVGDLGASAARKYDCEVWLPGQDAYRELTSASNCTDYQARRLRARYRDAEGVNQTLHTLNGTACAVGRTIIALLETHQRPDGTVGVPEALQPHLGTEVLS